jgi:hypothetical protein
MLDIYQRLDHASIHYYSYHCDHPQSYPRPRNLSPRSDTRPFRENPYRPCYHHLRLAPHGLPSYKTFTLLAELFSSVLKRGDFFHTNRMAPAIESFIWSGYKIS